MEGGTKEKESSEEKESDDHPKEDEGKDEKGFDQRQSAAAGSCEEEEHQQSQPPMMQWEDLSLRIAELEKQEQERRERSKSGGGTGLRSQSGGGGGVEDRHWRLWGAHWEEDEDEEDTPRCRVTSRFRNHKNLQLCFINDSDSEEDEGANKKLTVRCLGQVSTRRGCNGYHPSGLKQEVVVALRALRDKLWNEQRQMEEHLASSSVVAKRKRLEHCELQNCSVQQLVGLKESLQQDIQDLSSELVAHLLVRDQLRTKQDAMLLDVQDMT